MSKGKSEKGLVAESFDWDEESISSEDEGTTKIKAFMANRLYLSMNNGDGSLNLKKVIGKWTCSKATLDQLLSEKIPGNTVNALGGKNVTSDSESESDLTLNMADLTLNTSVLKKTKPTSDKVSPTYAIKKQTKTKSPVVPVPQTEKKADLSTEKLLLTLMDKVKILKERIKVPSENSPSVSQTRSSKSSK
ncbi:hypothetical protein Tco_1325706, partial [Tanacetum coccineum]